MFRFVVTTAATAALVMTGCAGDSPDAASQSSIPSDSVPAGQRDCVPVNPELEAQATDELTIELRDFAFDQDEYEVEAGTITFRAVNNGGHNHEVAFLPGGGDVPMTDGRPDEDALEAAGAFELEAFGAGLTCNATYELEPGTYTLFCIVPIGHDGHTHLDEGMQATLVVT